MARVSRARDKHKVPKVVLVRVVAGQLVKVDIMSKSVDKREEDDGPGDGLVEGDGLVKGDDAVEGGGAEPGDEGPANGEQDDTRVDVEDQGSATGNGESDADQGASLYKVVRVEKVEEGESEQADVDGNPESKEDDTVSCERSNEPGKVQGRMPRSMECPDIVNEVKYPMQRYIYKLKRDKEI